MCTCNLKESIILVMCPVYTRGSWDSIINLHITMTNRAVVLVLGQDVHVPLCEWLRVRMEKSHYSVSIHGTVHGWSICIVAVYMYGVKLQ